MLATRNRDDFQFSTVAWWKSGVIYQIYPRSFQDSGFDGIGDLPGIAKRLPYCESLGVTAIWLSPIYPSPMADFGYDISNFIDVHPLFGTLDQFDALVEEIHRRGMKVILDFVPNHTSVEHPWFQDSRSSRSSDKRNWYLWHDPNSVGGPPNNWLSNFGGSAWTWDESSQQYYYHAFLAQQPDLNWRNPAVVSAMHDVMRFWLKRGVDGFRIDVLWCLIKDDQWRDNPPNPLYTPTMAPNNQQLPLYTTDRPEVHTVVAALRKVADEFGDRVLIGEIYLPLNRLITYYGTNLNGVNLPFNFQLLQTEWNARKIDTLIREYEHALPAGAWPNWVLGNHDNPRISTRVGVPQARVAAMLLLTLRGTPTMYYGDEIGMSNVLIPADRVMDPFEKNVPGKGLGRDPCRTPMQWDTSRNAGFTTVNPWLPIANDFATVNVSVETSISQSFLGVYRQLLTLRNSRPSLSIGDYRPLTATGDTLAYLRRWEDECTLVVLNLGTQESRFSLVSSVNTGRLLLSTHGDRSHELLVPTLKLRANEGLMLDVAPEETGAP